MEYVATRDGVEIIQSTESATKKQKQFIKKLLKDFPDAKELFEYSDYLQTPNRGTASAFIAVALDTHLHEVESESGYMSYIAQRPRAEKHGGHGLFSEVDTTDLKAAKAELDAHDGKVWTFIFSLRREDAERLGYNKAAAWRNLLKHESAAIAEAMRIQTDDFRWYAAYHDEGHHPHVHMMAWSAEPKKGYLTREGIAVMRSRMTNAIFHEEMKELYIKKDAAYKESIQTAKESLLLYIRMLENSESADPVIEQKLCDLPHALEQVDGKHVYGYLPKEIKAQVDEIVEQLAQLPEVAACYEDTLHHNCVFVGVDENGEARHAHLRSSNSQGKVFRINVEGSEAKHSFHKDGADCSLYVFEAPIDLLSHITLYPAGWLEHSYVACCGTSVQPVLERLRQNQKLNMVYLCLDNDEAGEDACENMMEVLENMDVDVERLRPQGKDWNDDLRAKRGGHG